MTTRLKANLALTKCGVCNNWSQTEESQDFVVFRPDGTEEKLMFGMCNLKTSEPDSECVCDSFEPRVVSLDDDFVKDFKRAINDGNEALIHFRTTGDRSKFKKWLEKYGREK